MVLNLVLLTFTAAVGTHFGSQCAARGMLVRVSGDIIMMSPPLIITKLEVDKVHTQPSLH